MNYQYKFIFVKILIILFFIILIKLQFLTLFSQKSIRKKIPKRIFYKKHKIVTYQEPILPSNLLSKISSVNEFDKCLKEEFSYSKLHYKEKLDDNIDIIKKLNIIVIIFAGRKKFLEYNLEYMRKLLKEKLINKVHLWLYTNNKNDTRYIKDNSNLYKTCGKHQLYSEIFTEIENNAFNISIKQIILFL